MNEIALILPCYNEAKRLKIDQLSKFISVNKDLIDFYFVDDGSTDDTANLIKNNLSDLSNSSLIQLDQNSGKGKAIREALKNFIPNCYSWYGFIDADLDIPLEQILKLYENLSQSGALLAITNRKINTRVNILKPRTLASWCMVKIANNIIGFENPIEDTQCGCKLFKNISISYCFDEPFISEWLFDIEIFLRLKQSLPDARKHILEVPIIDLGKSNDSRFKFLHNLKVFSQLYQINHVYNKNEFFKNL